MAHEGAVPDGRRCDVICCGIDILPTSAAQAGVALPPGLELDGKDISAVLPHAAPTPHEALVLFNNENVVALRTQDWKYVDNIIYRTLPISMNKTTFSQLYDMRRRLAEARATFAPLALGAPKGYFGPLKQD